MVVVAMDSFDMIVAAVLIKSCLQLVEIKITAVFQPRLARIQIYLDGLNSVYAGQRLTDVVDAALARHTVDLDGFDRHLYKY